MTGTNLCVNKPQSVPVIFEPPSNTATYNKLQSLLYINCKLILLKFFEKEGHKIIQYMTWYVNIIKIYNFYVKYC